MKRLAGLLALALAACSQASAPVNIQDRDQVRAVVREYLVNDPHLLDEALAARAERRAAERLVQIQTDPHDFVIGRADAPVTIVEFFDYRCPYCHAAMNWVFETAASRNDVRVVFKEYPILGPDSLEASRAAIASIKQGRYQPFHRALMEFRGELSSQAIDAIAQSVGIDVARLRRDMADPGVDEIINRNHDLGAQAGINGTPTFFIGGEQWGSGFSPATAAAMRRRVDEAARDSRS